MQSVVAMEGDCSDRELRTQNCEQNFLSRPDGSASYTQGDTSVMVAVYGPAEIKLSKEIMDKATLEVIYKPKIGIPGCAEKFQERLIRNTCETVVLSSLHPRSSMTIIIQTLHNSGSFLSCCINGACMAMLDAGLPMKYLVASVTCALDNEDSIILDPTDKQEKEAKAVFTFAFDSQHYNVITSHTQGVFTLEQYHTCLDACRTASKVIFTFFRDSVKRKLSKS
ncbi:exosome complex component RRP46-like [Ptychodera flava]|uniref:exosome complex component RRP46-like n=1 Tax=Ptychodera flava TaxID=63121 RepID=UPI00396A91AA